MPTDLETLALLGRRLDEHRPILDRLDTYFTGTQPLAFLAPEVAEAVGSRLRSLAINWPRLVVASDEERLDVTGFRLGPDEPADGDLWGIWQANGLDEAAQLAHADALVFGRAYIMVWAGDDGAPRVTIESARQVTVARDPATRRRLAAVKRWVADGRAHAVLFHPDRVTRYVSDAHVPEGGVVPPHGWTATETLPNPLGVVPVVPLVNRARLLVPDGESELTDVLPLADAVNKLATDLMVSAEFHAMPRRWATGVELPEDDAGEPDTADAFSNVAGRAWMLEDPEARIGQFPEASLDGFLNAIRTLTHAIASVAALPPHYIALTATDNPASADAIRSSEASLVAKARRRQRSFGGAWEEAMRLAVAVRDGRPPSGLDRLETIWSDPETRTVAQAADAAVKLVAAGIIPPDQALEDLGYSPVQIDRIRTMRRTAALDAVATRPEALLP